MSVGKQQELRLLATMWDDGDTASIRLQERYPVAVEEVWSALTDRDRLAAWLGVFQGELRLGGEFHSRFHASGAEGTARVTECTPRTSLAIANRSENATGEVIRIGLTAGGDGSRIDLEHRGLLLEWLPGYAAGAGPDPSRGPGRPPRRPRPVRLRRPDGRAAPGVPGRSWIVESSARAHHQ